jgi:preprotein translocase subunit YajC
MFVNLLTVLLQAPTGGSPYFSLLFMVGMIAVMYFFMIRPQAKRAKEQKKFAESIAAGEKIVTTAGIHGTISRVNEDGTLKLEVGHGTFMTIERSAVSMEMTAAHRKRTEGVAVTAK